MAPKPLIFLWKTSQMPMIQKKHCPQSCRTFDVLTPLERIMKYPETITNRLTPVFPSSSML